MTLIKLYEGNECLWNPQCRPSDYKSQLKKRMAKVDIGNHFGLSGVYLMMASRPILISELHATFYNIVYKD